MNYARTNTSNANAKQFSYDHTGCPTRSRTLVGLTLNYDVQPFPISPIKNRQSVEHHKSKSTQPRSQTCWDTLY